MGTKSGVDPALYRAAVEEDLREWGAHFDEGSDATVAYLPDQPDKAPLRVILEATQVTIEGQTDAGEWQADTPFSYEAAWAMFARGRIRGARRMLAGLGLWVVLGAAVVVEIWLKGGPAWLHAVLAVGPLVGGAFLWFRQVPTREPYPGLFIAEGMFGISLLIRDSHPLVAIPLAVGVLAVALGMWGFMHCGGPEMSGYLASHISTDPRRTVSARR